MTSTCVLVVLSTRPDVPSGFDRIGEWTGAIGLTGAVPWRYAHLFRVARRPQVADPAGPVQPLSAEQRRRLFSATWECPTEYRLRADLGRLFGDPVIVEDPSEASAGRVGRTP